MRNTGLPIARFALDVIEERLRLVGGDEQVIALEAFAPAGVLPIIGRIGRRGIVILVLFDALPVGNGISIGLAVEPAVVRVDAVHIHIALAEPAHEAIAAVCLGQTVRFSQGLLLERHRGVALGKALRGPRKHGAHSEGIGVGRRLVLAELRRLDGCSARAGEIDRRLNALTVHGDAQPVVHRPLVGVRAF